MVAIRLIRKSGPRNNWFSNLPPYVIGSALAIIVLYSILSWCTANGLSRVGHTVDQIAAISKIVLKVHAAHAQADLFLSSSTLETFTTANEALVALSPDIQNSSSMLNPSQQRQLESVDLATLNFLNAFRSLKMLLAVPGARNAVDPLRTSLSAVGLDLDRSVDDLLTENVGMLQQVVREQGYADDQLRFALFIMLLLVCGIPVVWSTRNTNQKQAAMQGIIDAVQAISAGDFSTHVKLTRTDQIGQLATAINQLADGLKTLVSNEAAANDQNRLQLIKLARQERLTAILEERQRIARDLHDSVKQQLFSLTLAAGAALNLLDHNVDLARTYIKHVRESGTAAQAEMTNLLQEMRPLSLQDRHLEEALLQYLTPICDVHQIKLLWRVAGTNALPIAHEHVLFRIVQEAVGNVIRHSAATVLRISLNFGLRTVLIVEDNGNGFDLQMVAPTSTGLSIMRRRLKQVGGTLSIQSSPCHGTRLEVMIDARN
jgi:NarL family two-component system sensor histidine kinase LiaS